jgi:hypothetical protein
VVLGGGHGGTIIGGDPVDGGRDGVGSGEGEGEEEGDEKDEVDSERGEHGCGLVGC